MSFASLTLLALAPQTALAIPQRAPAPAPVRVEVLATLEASAGSGLDLFLASSGRDVGRFLPGELTGGTGLQLLPLDFVGRTELTEQTLVSPRLRLDVPAAARVVLPGGYGTVYRYRRGGAVFGFLHVDASGHPRAVLERPAGPGGADPFVPFIGVAPEGRALLTATRPFAGGDLVEVDLEAGTEHVRTSSVPPLDFGIDGLWLGETFGFGVASTGVWRFARTPNAEADPVPVPSGPPAFWTGAAMMSPRRTFAVAVAGPNVNETRPYVFGAFGPARPATTTNMKLSGAGFAHETTFGPFLAVTDDGSLAGWRVDDVVAPNGQLSNEVFLGRPAATSQSVAVTGDTYLIDTLTEVGRVFASAVGGISYFAGEDNDPSEGGLESADLFEAMLSTGGVVAVRNVSLTSGQTVPPFAGGVPTWTPARVVLLTPRYLLIHEDDEKRFVALDLLTGSSSIVMSSVREILWIERTSTTGSWCAAVERDSANREFQVIGAPTPFGQAAVLDAGTPASNYRYPVSSFELGTACFERTDPGSTSLRVLSPSTGFHAIRAAAGETFAPPFAFLSDRRVAFSSGPSANAVRQRVWPFFGSAFGEVAVQAPARDSILVR